MVRAPLGESEGLARARCAASRSALIGPLAKILRDPDRRDEHAFAASLLADYAADDPRPWSTCSWTPTRSRSRPCFRPCKGGPRIAIGDLRGIRRSLPGPASMGPPEPAPASRRSPRRRSRRAKDRLASRGARAAVGPVCGSASRRGLAAACDTAPTRGCAAPSIHPLSTLGVDPALLGLELDGSRRSTSPPRAEKDAYLFDPVTSTRRALIMALAGYATEAPGCRRAGGLRRPGWPASFATTPMPGSTRRQGWSWSAGDTGDRLKLGARRRSRRGRGADPSSMVRQPRGPDDGPRRRPGRVRDGLADVRARSNRDLEVHHRRIIPRRFAIASKEVSAAEIRRLRQGEPGSRRSSSGESGSGPGRAADRGELVPRRRLLQLAERSGGPAPLLRAGRRGQFAAGMTIDPRAVERGGYRLPTEAEWEYACRAGTFTSRYYGNAPELLGSMSGIVGNSSTTPTPCGRLLPNDLGLFDMLGNVADGATTASTTIIPTPRGHSRSDRPRSGTADARCVRCESFFMYPTTLRSAARVGPLPGRGADRHRLPARPDAPLIVAGLSASGPDRIPAGLALRPSLPADRPRREIRILRERRIAVWKRTRYTQEVDGP